MISEKIAKHLVIGADKLISQASNVVILTHLSPDGDAMGSSLGFKHWLIRQGKKVNVVVPNVFPDFLHWMPGAADDLVYENSKLQADELMEQADLIICTDFNEPKRIGTLGDKLMNLLESRPTLSRQSVLLVDHHLFPADFADVTISYPDSPSASELVYRLISQISVLRQQPFSLDLDTATCLYTGMMTDTGNFSFNSNYPEMYEIVGNLVGIGVNKDAVYNAVFNSYKADRMRLMGFCLYQKMRIFPEYHTALIFLSRKELYRFNFQSGDAEGIVNLPLQIKDVYYSCFMREDKVYPSEVSQAGGSNIKVKISMRSQGDRPVNTFCHDIFNGGGHMNASGGEYYGPIAEAVKLFVDNYANFFRQD
ncbi:MAG: DHH family phosphoesterase [Paludibacteraceae bacterium]|nr:DHH family phosphoesterase [Paludibacteraceae bacterium]